MQSEKLKKNPRLILLEGLLEKCQRSLDDTDSTTLKVNSALSLWYEKDRDPHKALSFLESEEAHLRHKSDLGKLGALLTRKGSLQVALYDIKHSVQSLKESIQLNKGQKNTSDFDNYRLMAIILGSQGDYKLQVEYAKHALSLATKPSEECAAHYELFRGNIWLGNKTACEEAIEDLLKLSNEYGLDYEKGLAYYCRAWLNAELRNHSIAIKNYELAIQQFLKSDHDVRIRRISFCYSGMGIQYEKLKKSKLAIQYARKGVEESDKFYGKPYQPGTAIPYHNLAVRYMRDKDYESGIRQVQNAIKCFIQDPDFSDARMVIPREELHKVHSKWDLLRSLKDKALCYAHLYIKHKNEADAISAEKHMGNAIDLIDIMRAELSTLDVKVFWRGKTKRYYNDIIEICDWLGDEEKMLKYMEKSRSLLLLDELNHKDALDLIPNNLMEREERLREAFSNVSEKDVTKYENYLNFLDSLKEAYPHYYKYKFQTTTPTIAEVQTDLVTDSSQVLQYYLTRDSIYTFSITSDTTEILTHERPDDLETEVNRLLSLVSNKDSLEYQGSYQEFLSIAQHFHDLLFKDLKIKHKDIKLISDGVIDLIPFDILIESITDGEPKFLIESHAFSYAPSLSILLKLKRKNKFNSLIVVSPEEFESLGLAPMERIDEEIDHISQLTNTKLLRGTKATFQNFIKESEGIDVIHLSSHSGLDSLHKPWIALNDSIIPLEDIYKLKLDASLVTLSSCKSSSGVLQQGEGVNSLSRAFLFSDVSSVVASKWNLNESSGLSVIKDFYSNINNEESKALSLRSAKLKYIKDNPYKSPYYWSSFILIGDDSPLYRSAEHSGFGILFMLLALVGLVFVIRRFI